jgi:twitching motility two-component system response regulator PilG
LAAVFAQPHTTSIIQKDDLIRGATVTSNDPETQRVLVVDDSETIRRSAEIFLKQAGYEVIMSSDGFDALAKICDHNPDLILVDIMMPKLDGYQTCHIVKQNPAYAGTPVIMLSSKDGVFDRARGRIAGSDQYLTKPVTRDGLLTAVKTQLSARSNGAAAS